MCESLVVGISSAPEHLRLYLYEYEHNARSGMRSGGTPPLLVLEECGRKRVILKILKILI
jgi:hypothetical protein